MQTASDETAFRTLQNNIATVQRRISDACLRAGREVNSVRLVAASKSNSPERIMLAKRAGIGIFGENRVQELCEKRDKGAYEGAELHLIGHLQRNKVKQVAGQLELIHSVDSLELLSAINACCEKQQKQQKVLIELNLDEEASKTGLSPALLEPLLEQAGKLSAVSIVGLMGIPPKNGKCSENCNYFGRMQELFIDIQRKKYDNVKMAELSMGMSADFEEAILEGATLIRIGTAIFGARDYGTLE